MSRPPKPNALRLKLRNAPPRRGRDTLPQSVRPIKAEHLTESARDQHAQARAIDPDVSDSGQDQARRSTSDLAARAAERHVRTTRRRTTA